MCEANHSRSSRCDLIWTAHHHMEFSIRYGSCLVVHLLHLLGRRGTILRETWKKKRKNSPWTCMNIHKMGGKSFISTFLCSLYLNKLNFFHAPLFSCWVQKKITILQRVHKRVANSYSYIDCFYTDFSRTHNLNEKLFFLCSSCDENSLFDSYQTKSSISVGTKRNVEQRKIFFLKKNVCMENKIASNFTTSLPLNIEGRFGSVQFPLQIFDFKNHIFNF